MTCRRRRSSTANDEKKRGTRTRRTQHRHSDTDTWYTAKRLLCLTKRWLGRAHCPATDKPLSAGGAGATAHAIQTTTRNRSAFPTADFEALLMAPPPVVPPPTRQPEGPPETASRPCRWLPRSPTGGYREGPSFRPCKQPEPRSQLSEAATVLKPTAPVSPYRVDFVPHQKSTETQLWPRRISFQRPSDAKRPRGLVVGFFGHQQVDACCCPLSAATVAGPLTAAKHATSVSFLATSSGSPTN